MTTPRIIALAMLGPCLAASVVASAQHSLPPTPPLTESPWNGDWVLSETRNSKLMRDAGAEGYRFHLMKDGRIKWEIPTLREVVEGRTDGHPMAIHRPKASGLTLAVKRVGARTLTYQVAKNGKPKGEGRMTLIDQGRTWVDVSQPYGRPDLAGVLIYVRPEDVRKT